MDWNRADVVKSWNASNPNPDKANYLRGIGNNYLSANGRSALNNVLANRDVLRNAQTIVNEVGDLAIKFKAATPEIVNQTKAFALQQIRANPTPQGVLNVVDRFMPFSANPTAGKSSGSLNAMEQAHINAAANNSYNFNNGPYLPGTTTRNSQTFISGNGIIPGSGLKVAPLGNGANVAWRPSQEGAAYQQAKAFYGETTSLIAGTTLLRSIADAANPNATAALTANRTLTNNSINGSTMTAPSYVSPSTNVGFEFYQQGNQSLAGIKNFNGNTANRLVPFGGTYGYQEHGQNLVFSTRTGAPGIASFNSINNTLTIKALDNKWQENIRPLPVAFSSLPGTKVTQNLVGSSISLAGQQGFVSVYSLSDGSKMFAPGKNIIVPVINNMGGIDKQLSGKSGALGLYVPFAQENRNIFKNQDFFTVTNWKPADGAYFISNGLGKGQMMPGGEPNYLTRVDSLGSKLLVQQARGGWNAFGSDNPAFNNTRLIHLSTVTRDDFGRINNVSPWEFNKNGAGTMYASSLNKGFTTTPIAPFVKIDTKTVLGVDPNFGMSVRNMFSGVTGTYNITKSMKVTSDLGPVFKLQKGIQSVGGGAFDNTVWYGLARPQALTGNFNNVPFAPRLNEGFSGPPRTFGSHEFIEVNSTYAINNSRFDLKANQLFADISTKLPANTLGINQGAVNFLPVFNTNGAATFSPVLSGTAFVTGKGGIAPDLGAFNTAASQKLGAAFIRDNGIRLTNGVAMNAVININSFGEIGADLKGNPLVSGFVIGANGVKLDSLFTTPTAINGINSTFTKNFGDLTITQQVKDVSIDGFTKINAFDRSINQISENRGQLIYNVSGFSDQSQLLNTFDMVGFNPKDPQLWKSFKQDFLKGFNPSTNTFNSAIDMAKGITELDFSGPGSFRFYTPDNSIGAVVAPEFIKEAFSNNITGASFVNPMGMGKGVFAQVAPITHGSDITAIKGRWGVDFTPNNQGGFNVDHNTSVFSPGATLITAPFVVKNINGDIFADRASGVHYAKALWLGAGLGQTGHTTFADNGGFIGDSSFIKDYAFGKPISMKNMIDKSGMVSISNGSLTRFDVMHTFKTDGFTIDNARTMNLNDFNRLADQKFTTTNINWDLSYAQGQGDLKFGNSTRAFTVTDIGLTTFKGENPVPTLRVKGDFFIPELAGGAGNGTELVSKNPSILNMEKVVLGNRFATTKGINGENINHQWRVALANGVTGFMLPDIKFDDNGNVNFGKTMDISTLALSPGAAWNNVAKATSTATGVFADTGMINGKYLLPISHSVSKDGAVTYTSAGTGIYPSAGNILTLGKNDFNLIETWLPKVEIRNMFSSITPEMRKAWENNIEMRNAWFDQATQGMPEVQRSSLRDSWIKDFNSVLNTGIQYKVNSWANYLQRDAVGNMSVPSFNVDFGKNIQNTHQIGWAIGRVDGNGLVPLKDTTTSFLGKSIATLGTSPLVMQTPTKSGNNNEALLGWSNLPFMPDGLIHPMLTKDGKPVSTAANNPAMQLLNGHTYSISDRVGGILFSNTPTLTSMGISQDGKFNFQTVSVAGNLKYENVQVAQKFNDGNMYNTKWSDGSLAIPWSMGVSLDDNNKPVSFDFSYIGGINNKTVVFDRTGNLIDGAGMLTAQLPLDHTPVVEHNTENNKLFSMAPVVYNFRELINSKWENPSTMSYVGNDLNFKLWQKIDDNGKWQPKDVIVQDMSGRYLVKNLSAIEPGKAIGGTPSDEKIKLGYTLTPTNTFINDRGILSSGDSLMPAQMGVDNKGKFNFSAVTMAEGLSYNYNSSGIAKVGGIELQIGKDKIISVKDSNVLLPDGSFKGDEARGDLNISGDYLVTGGKITQIENATYKDKATGELLTIGQSPAGEKFGLDQRGRTWDMETGLIDDTKLATTEPPKIDLSLEKMQEPLAARASEDLKSVEFRDDKGVLFATAEKMLKDGKLVFKDDIVIGADGLKYKVTLDGDKASLSVLEGQTTTRDFKAGKDFISLIDGTKIPVLEDFSVDVIVGAKGEVKFDMDLAELAKQGKIDLSGQTVKQSYNAGDTISLEGGGSAKVL
ncbi:MAG: hypothetical protein WC546_06700, partial [Candidatus Omnitrophota bacterium]